MNDGSASAAGTERLLRETVVRACRELLALRLTSGAAGNISVRFGAGMIISPSAAPYGDLEPDMLQHITLDGERVGGVAEQRPSTEWRLHAVLLRTRPEVGAVVHAHPPYATALACLRRPIPAFHYMVAAAGGADIPCSAYATPGTAELASAAMAVLRSRDACLLANHGIVAAGASVERALALAITVETLAEQYCHALAVGEPVLLTAAEMADALHVVRKYQSGA